MTKSRDLTAALPDLSAIKWRCRRGMLELDILLNQFVENEYKNLNHDQVSLFDMLLDYPDQVLYDLLLEKTNAADYKVTELIKIIRKSAI